MISTLISTRDVALDFFWIFQDRFIWSLPIPEQEKQAWLSLGQILHLAQDCSLSWGERVRQRTKHDVQKSLFCGRPSIPRHGNAFWRVAGLRYAVFFYTTCKPPKCERKPFADHAQMAFTALGFPRRIFWGKSQAFTIERRFNFQPRTHGGLTWTNCNMSWRVISTEKQTESNWYKTIQNSWNNSG